MFSFSDIESGLLFVPLLDVDMAKVFYKINYKNLITNLIQLSTQFIEAFSSLLALTFNNCNKFQIKNHAAPLRNFSPHSTGICPQIMMFKYSTTHVKHRL